MVAGGDHGGHRSGGGQRRSEGERHRARGRGQRGWGSASAHPGEDAVDGEGRGGRTAALRCSEATAGGGRGIGQRQRVRASRNDSLHGEDEADAAQLKAVFDLLLGDRKSVV